MLIVLFFCLFVLYLSVVWTVLWMCVTCCSYHNSFCMLPLIKRFVVGFCRCLFFVWSHFSGFDFFELLKLLHSSMWIIMRLKCRVNLFILSWWLKAEDLSLNKNMWLSCTELFGLAFVTSPGVLVHRYVKKRPVKGAGSCRWGQGRSCYFRRIFHCLDGFLLLIGVLCISMLQVLFSVSALKDLTPTAEIKASSRQAMIGSLSGQCTSWHLCGNRVCVWNLMNDKTYGNGDVCGALTAVSTVHDLYSCCVHKQTWLMQTIKTKCFECIVFSQNELSIIINTEPCYPTDLP